MLIKPFGLCCKCSERKNCVVVTETNAEVLDCPVFNRSDLRRSNNQPYKMTKKK